MDVSWVNLRRESITIERICRKKRNAFRYIELAFWEICGLLRSSIGRIEFLGCWMWPCHWDLRCRMWAEAVFVTSLSWNADFGAGNLGSAKCLVWKHFQIEMYARAQRIKTFVLAWSTDMPLQALCTTYQCAPDHTPHHHPLAMHHS